MGQPDLRPFVAGRHHDSASPVTLPSIDPTTEQVLWQVPVGDPADADLAVGAARRACTGAWARDTALRVEALTRLAELVEHHADELSSLDTQEIGVPISITSGDVGLAAAIARGTVAMIDDLGADAEPPSRRVPRGVVAVLSPWNFPFFVAFTKSLPALAAGNAVVLKPTELATASAMRLGELAHEAGLPDGAFSVIPGRGDVVGDALVRHAGVDQVSLTGSVETGRRVLATAAATTLAPVQTELGGKSAIVVGEHVADLAMVADAVARSIFWASGQVCSAGSRLIVHERHHAELVALLLERTAAWQPGDPTDPAVEAGPLGSEAHLAHVMRCIDGARADGGAVLAGGERLDRRGWFVAPTIVDRVAPGHRLFSTEVFGPVLAVTTCSSTADGIALANATNYGLLATGWSDDATEAAAMAEGLRAAWVTVNPHLAGPPNPRAGAESIGWSGSGVEGGLPAMRAATRLAVVAWGLPDIPTPRPDTPT